jgi:hypothetical protein
VDKLNVEGITFSARSGKITLIDEKPMKIEE